MWQDGVIYNQFLEWDSWPVLKLCSLYLKGKALENAETTWGGKYTESLCVSNKQGRINKCFKNLRRAITVTLHGVITEKKATDSTC